MRRHGVRAARHPHAGGQAHAAPGVEAADLLARPGDRRPGRLPRGRRRRGHRPRSPVRRLGRRRQPDRDGRAHPDVAEAVAHPHGDGVEADARQPHGDPPGSRGDRGGPVLAAPRGPDPRRRGAREAGTGAGVDRRVGDLGDPRRPRRLAGDVDVRDDRRRVVGEDRPQHRLGRVAGPVARAGAHQVAPVGEPGEARPGHLAAVARLRLLREGHPLRRPPRPRGRR